ncbi:MAG: AsmA-like C-terminal region-containing protein [Gemmatimonadales bacterium]
MTSPTLTRRRKIAAVAAGAVVVVLALLLVLPRLFEGPVEARVRAQIEQATRVRVSWSDAALGLLRSFPHATLALRDLTVVGTGGFEGDTLAVVGSLDVAIDLWSGLRAALGRGPLVVRSVRIQEPVVHLRVRDDGTANWDVMAERPEQAEAPGEGARRGLAVSLRRFELTDGSVSLENARSGLFGSLEGLRHSLRGDFGDEELTATTSAHADRVGVRFAGVPYLTGVALDLDAELAVDMAARRVRLQDNELRLNDLVLRWSGEAAQQDENLALDLSFEAPGAEFGEILSLVPAIYAQDFASLQTSGTFAVEGTVRGVYGPGQFPALAIRASIDEGTFRYPDLPLPARAIMADLAIDNPGGDLDSTVVSLSRFHVEIGDQPLDAAFTLRTPVSDPEIDARVAGTLDLDAVARTVKLAPTREIGGVVVADASVHARRSDVDSARYENIAAEGTVSATGVTLRSPELRQPVSVDEARIELSPERAELRTLRAQLGSSDVEASGRLDNLLAFGLGRAPLAGTATFTSRRFVLDEWRSGGELSAIPVPPMLDLALSGSIDQLEMGNLIMTNARGDARVQDQRLTFDGFGLETLGGRIGLDGWYETLDPARPTFELALAMDSLDVNRAAEAFVTVRSLAPVARYARGTFSADLDLSGALGEDMSPALDVLDGAGSLSTSRLAIEGMPLLQRLSDALRLSQLASPTVSAIRSSIRIEDGRLHVSPFTTELAGIGMSVGGSNGIDQSLDYTLGLTVPSGALGDAATSVVSDLARRAGLPAPTGGVGQSVQVAVRVGGTVTEPSLDLGIGNPVASAGDQARQAAGAAIQQRVDDAQQRLDAQREEGRRRAQAQADSLVADAGRRAEEIRAEAARLAAGVRAEANRAADEVLARATNPIARAAAEPVAARMRQEGEERARTIEREAAERADALVAETRARADAIVGGN